MSRSRKHHPFHATCVADSEKDDKRRANRRLRRRLHQVPADEDAVIPLPREVSNVWLFAKDGKSRFDPITWPEMMRK